MLPSSGPEDAAENDSGVIGLVEVAGLRVLVTGDIELAGQQALLASGADVRADVLVVPHHGSAKQEPTLIQAVGASVALIQVGERNDYGHPAAATLRLLHSSGSSVFRTDQQGAIAVSADGRRVVTQRRHANRPHPEGSGRSARSARPAGQPRNSGFMCRSYRFSVTLRSTSARWVSRASR